MELITTLRDLLHAINILGYDTDVTIDGIDSIAVVPPVKLTKEGSKHFHKALSATVEVVYKDDCHRYTCVSDDDKINRDAWALLWALSGSCTDSDYQTWFEKFEDENATII